MGIHYDGDTDDLSAQSTGDWATVSIDGGKLKVKVTANSGEAARTATVTVTDGTSTATVSVSQNKA